MVVLQARLGGHGFPYWRGRICVHMWDDGGRASAEGPLPRIGPALAGYGDVPCPISVSIGFAAYPDGGASFDDLCKEADKALYHAKRKGKRQCVFCGDIA